MAERELRLESLQQGMPAITAAFGEMLAEAAAVCFENQKHETGVTMNVESDPVCHFRVFWPPVTEQMLACYNDMGDTVEHAAYGVAILLLKDLVGKVAIERS